MADSEFWALIDVMGGNADRSGLSRLKAALRRQGENAAVAFQERLAGVLYELDREDLAAQRVRLRDDPPDSEPLPLSDDSFLYLRAGLVARGRDMYLAARADPSLLASGVWDDGEDLLYVAEEVAGREIETAISYETGSNVQHWTDTNKPAREDGDQGRPPVYVEFRDLSKPMDAERVYSDGRTETLFEYEEPEFLDYDLIDDVSRMAARAVALNGGLPAAVDAVQVQVIIDFGDKWRLQPEIGEPIEDDWRVRPVRVSVCADEVARWNPTAIREALHSLTASCVLAVLPEDHDARAELEQIQSQGAAQPPWQQGT